MRRATLVLSVAVGLVFGAAGASPTTAAAAPAPHWTVSAYAAPTDFAPNTTEKASYHVQAHNVGAAATAGAEPIVLTDTLPEGLTAEAVQGRATFGENQPLACSIAAHGVPTCTWNPAAQGAVPPDGTLTMTVTVTVGAVAEPTLTDAAAVSGGAPTASTQIQTPLSAADAPFGIDTFAFGATEPAGLPSTQAAAHPYALTVDLNLSTFNSHRLSVQNQRVQVSGGKVRDLLTDLPLGFLGNPQAATQCPEVDLAGRAECPASSQVGILVARTFNAQDAFSAGGGGTEIPVYNMTPSPGFPAELGFSFDEQTVILFPTLRPGDYGLAVAVAGVTRTLVLSGAEITVWGVPAAAAHDSQRAFPGSCGHYCTFGAPPGHPERPFLTEPSDCADPAQPASLYADSWQDPATVPVNPAGSPAAGAPDFGAADFSEPQWASRESAQPQISGCGALTFEPTLSLHPDTARADSPAGLEANLEVPQNEEPEGEATPPLRSAIVTLPAGLAVNPSSADGLQGCTPTQIGALAPSNEVQTIASPGASLTLSYAGHSTVALPPAASAAEVAAALAALPGLSAADLAVSGGPGGPWKVEFTGPLAGREASPITASEGEVQSLAVDATGGTFNLSLGAQSTAASATGNLSAATGNGTLSAASGHGTLSQGSATLTTVSANSGAFAVGQTIAGAGIPAGTTIIALGAGTLEISAPATESGANVAIKAGSKLITGVTTSTGAYAVGQQIAATGIPAGSTITAVGAGTLEISAAATSSGSKSLKAGSTTVTALSPTAGAMLPGEAIAGAGIPAGTTILAVGSGTLELSKAPTLPESADALAAALPFNASAATLQSALQALPAIGAGNVIVTGGPGNEGAGSPYRIAFAAALGASAVEALGATAALTGSAHTAAISTPIPAGQPDPVQRTQPAGQARFSGAAATCPPASKIGEVQVITPLLKEPLPGQVFIGAPECSPCSPADASEGKLLKLYIQVDEPERGVIVKLAGSVAATETETQPGRLTATFAQNPQLPFSDLKLNFKSGDRATLTTPSTCGKYTTASRLTPWSAPETPTALSESSFEVSEGCAKTAAEEPNQPRFEAGTVNPSAGAYSPFVLKLSREPGSQAIKGLDATLPPGLTGKLAGVPYCSDAQIAAAAARSGSAEKASPSCPLASEVGTVNVGAGSGAPFYVQGHAYLAGPYKGAPLEHGDPHPGGCRPLRPRHRRRPHRPLRQPRNRPDHRQVRPDPDRPRRHPARRPLGRRRHRPQPVHPQPDQLRQARAHRRSPRRLLRRERLRPLPGRRLQSPRLCPQAGDQPQGRHPPRRTSCSQGRRHLPDQGRLRQHRKGPGQPASLRVSRQRPHRHRLHQGPVRRRQHLGRKVSALLGLRLRPRRNPAARSAPRRPRLPALAAPRPQAPRPGRCLKRPDRRRPHRQSRHRPQQGHPQHLRSRPRRPGHQVHARNAGRRQGPAGKQRKHLRQAPEGDRRLHGAEREGRRLQAADCQQLQEEAPQTPQAPPRGPPMSRSILAGAGEGLALGGQQLQRLDVPRPHDVSEVTVVQSAELRLSEALDHRQHSAVDKADILVDVGPQQLSGALVVAGHEVLHRQSAAPHLLEHSDEGFVTDVFAEQVVDLYQHRGGDDTALPCLVEQRRAGPVRIIITIESADQNRGVEDQRDGSGSKTSRLAISLRSPRPELNAPMQVSGGCSPSSAPSSCSNASLTSCGTATPRSRATRRARSNSALSTSMLVVGEPATEEMVAPTALATESSLAASILTPKTIRRPVSSHPAAVVAASSTDIASETTTHTSSLAHTNSQLLLDPPTRGRVRLWRAPGKRCKGRGVAWQRPRAGEDAAARSKPERASSRNLALLRSERWAQHL